MGELADITAALQYKWAVLMVTMACVSWDDGSAVEVNATATAWKALHKLR